MVNDEKTKSENISKRSQIDQEERGKGNPTQRRAHLVIPFSNRIKEAN